MVGELLGREGVPLGRGWIGEVESGYPLAASPSRDMPTERHFLKRHCWQRLRLMRTMEQFSFFRHFLYWMFCWMLLRKKPWRAGVASEPLGSPRLAL